MVNKLGLVWGYFTDLCDNNEVGIGNFLRERNGDGENLMGMRWGWGQFNLPSHSLL